MAGVASKYFDVETLKERFLECDICKEIFDEENHHPRLLPCLHTLCKECIVKLLTDEKITCPKCQKLHKATGNSIETFPKDNTRRDLLDFVKVQKEPTNINCESCDKNLPAKFRCKDCSEFLCTECNDFHVHNKTFKKHYVFSIESIDFEKAQLENFKHESSCSIHGHKDALNFYCHKNICKKPICTTCAIAEHKETNGHILRDILEVYSQEKAQMEKKRETLEQKKESALSIVKLIEKEENDLYQNGEVAKENIRAQFETCLKILERRRDELVQDVDATMSRKQRILEVHRQGLENLNDFITDAINFYDQSLLYKNYPAFLQIVTTMKNRFEYLIAQKIDVIPHENACCEFSALNMGMGFQKYVNTIGKMYHTSVYPPNTVIEATLPEGKDKDVLISVIFRDKSGNEITDSDTIPNVTVRIISVTEPINEVEIPCKSSQNGKYYALTKGLSPGKYKFEAVMFKKCFGSDVKEIEYKNKDLQEPDEVEKAENQLPIANADPQKPDEDKEDKHQLPTANAENSDSRRERQNGLIQMLKPLFR